MIKCTKEKIEGKFGAYDVWAIRFGQLPLPKGRGLNSDV